jgi:hypothetical protein
MGMKNAYILLLLLAVMAGCRHYNNRPDMDNHLAYDSVYVIADIQWHQQYYPLLDRQVFSIDLLTDGLAFDSAYHITGTGLNLYFSDIFADIDETLLPDGLYRMDTTTQMLTFLPYQYFEGGNITGCYMLDIEESQVQRIIGFTAGEFTLTSLGEDIRMDISLYTADSTHYRAIYQGPAFYR